MCYNDFSVMKKYIVSDPHILGGTPVIIGTRIPVERILFLLKEGYTIEDIQQEYNHVDIKTLEHVIEEIIKMIVKNPHGSQVPSL